jgi:hypothetical protein
MSELDDIRSRSWQALEDANGGVGSLDGGFAEGWDAAWDVIDQFLDDNTRDHRDSPGAG